MRASTCGVSTVGFEPLYWLFSPSIRCSRKRFFQVEIVAVLYPSAARASWYVAPASSSRISLARRTASARSFMDRARDSSSARSASVRSKREACLSMPPTYKFGTRLNRPLADDVRYYGRWMRDEAEKRIGHLYPKLEITPELAKERPDLKPYVGRKLTVIAWLWTRTVKSPNPAFANVDVPLASTFMLSTKSGKEAYVEPVIEDGGYRFTVKVGKPKDAERAKRGTKLSRGANFECLMSGTPIASEHIYGE